MSMQIIAKPSARGDIVIAKYNQIVRMIPATGEVIYRCDVRSDASFMLANWYFFDNVIRDNGIILTVKASNLYIDDVKAQESMEMEIWKYNELINKLTNDYNFPSQKGLYAYRQIRFDIKISNPDMLELQDIIDNIIILKTTQAQSFTINIYEPV